MDFKDSLEFKELLAKAVIRDLLYLKSKVACLIPMRYSARYWENYIKKEHGEN